MAIWSFCTTNGMKNRTALTVKCLVDVPIIQAALSPIPINDKKGICNAYRTSAV